MKYLESDVLRLETGEEIPSDAILCGTGWVPSLQFFSENQCEKLGLPHLIEKESEKEKYRWTELMAEADGKVIANFPLLAKPPPHWHRPVTQTPYRLYRQMVPLSESCESKEDRSIVLVGHVVVGHYFSTVECQSLWATAYLDGKLELPSREEQEKEVALMTAWCRRRYLSNGEEGNNMTLEVTGYIDTLLRDLGLSSHRKGWFKHWFACCWASDFKGLKAEFVERFGYSESSK